MTELNHQRHCSNFQNDNYLTDYEIDTTLQELLNRYDRMTMANSIEGRVPFCDHNIVNFAYKLKNKFKIHKGSQKHILKKLSERYLDKDIIYRKKVGFSLPIEEWFNKNVAGLFCFAVVWSEGSSTMNVFLHNKASTK